MAIAVHTKPVVNPPYPNPPTTTDAQGTYLQFYHDVAPAGHSTAALQSSFGIHGNGRLEYRTGHRLGFIVYGNDDATRRRMMRVFGHDKDVISFDTGGTGGWQSPFIASEEKPEHDTPIDPYILLPPYTWWGPLVALDDKSLGDFIDENGKKFVHIEYKMANMNRPVKRDMLYEEILNSPSVDHALELILHMSIQHRFNEDGRLSLTKKRNTTCDITFKGMPCDVVSRLLGLQSYQPFVCWYANRSKNRVKLKAKIMSAPTGYWMRVEFRKRKGFVEHAHRFSMAFLEDSPFYPFAKVTVREVDGGAFLPPKGFKSAMVMPKELKVWIKGTMHIDDGGNDGSANIPVDGTTILPFEPFKLAGLIPHGANQCLMIKRGWKRNVPESVYRARIAAKRTPEALIAAFYTLMNHAISDDPDNTQHGVKAEELLQVIYDKNTCKYIFECGPKAASVRMKMRKSMAELFGMLPADEAPSLPFMAMSVASPQLDNLTHATDSNMDWARKGHAIVKHP
ncbi:hypothetical protein CAPTEDRAFT_213160 [Capitella teleta]|uniref:Uncharacterized protein n=1 Tax=Capitella teleta TaxID=283909 RepID=R7VAR3_CAPTE|nr:hypothetical protein CAPTEDRAFT_213160 [Capitella teleta]|eukprot:ELU15938.1 hypothetical protein CAPTEDRAFT_213160 [Capitella teleta]